MTATLSRSPNLEFIQSQETWTFSVGYNVSYITMAGKFFFSSYCLCLSNLFIGRLHAGISTIDPQARAAIPFSAFADAIEEYEAESGTDDEGDMMNA